MERFAKIAAQAISDCLGAPLTAADLETPPDPTLGDFGFPCFKLAKQFRKSPPQVAIELASKIGGLPSDLTVRAVGPYVNFSVQPQALARALLQDILSGDGLGRYGSLPLR